MGANGNLEKSACSLLLGGMLLTCPLPASAAPPGTPQVQRGAYLVVSSGCGDCHTPMKLGPAGPQPDATLSLAGHPAGLVMPPPPALPPGPWGGLFSLTNTAWAGPWGVSYTANLTSDAQTGLGSWTEATFLAAIRTGRHLGKGRPILPPMPVLAMQHLTDEDLKAMFAYLQTVPAIKNPVPEPQPPTAPAPAGQPPLPTPPAGPAPGGK